MLMGTQELGKAKVTAGHRDEAWLGPRFKALHRIEDGGFLLLGSRDGQVQSKRDAALLVRTHPRGSQVEPGGCAGVQSRNKWNPRAAVGWPEQAGEGRGHGVAFPLAHVDTRE